MALANLVFENITDYGFMHSSNFISPAILNAVEIGADFVNTYLEQSLKEVDHFFKQKTQYEVREENKRG